MLVFGSFGPPLVDWQKTADNATDSYATIVI